LTVAAVIEKKLRADFAPTRLDVEDQSHLHAGHAGARPGGQSHFSVEIVSARFAGKSRVDRQRLVYECLAGEMASDIHALALRVLTPDEDRAE